MRLAQLDLNGPRACIYHEQQWFDLQQAVPGLPSNLRGVLEQGAPPLQAALERIRSGAALPIPKSGVRFAPPIHDPQKIICLGLNYADHAKESGAPLPRDPVLFSKYPTAIIGPEAAIRLPAISEEVDFEAELVIVVGRAGRQISLEQASGHIAGYTVGHDVSARDWQLKKDGKQWMVGKTFDTFAPIGPVLVTSDEIGDPHALDISLRLNGVVMQQSNTRQMVFKAADIIHHLSKIFTLSVGDLIFTGTPPGVGMARKPPVYLKAGDVVEVEIEKIGVLRNPVVADS